MIEIRNDNSIILSNGDDFDVVFIAGKDTPLPTDAAELKLEIKHDIRRDAIISGACDKIIDTPEGEKALYFNIPSVKKLPPAAYYYDLHFDVGGKRKTLTWPNRLFIAEISHDLN